MDNLKKSMVFILLFLIIIVLAALYGMLHNQISFTVSSEYFTCFKFEQFHIDKIFHNRLGAGIVGTSATWWMGIVIGVFLIPIGLIIPTWKAYLIGMIRVFLVVCLTAFSVGIIAMLIGLITINTNNLPDFLYPSSVQNKVRFAQAGNMHNFSYLGGLIGIITGIIRIIIEKRMSKQNSSTIT